jgi:hypothetical protein
VAVIGHAFETTAQADGRAIRSVLGDLAQAGLSESTVAFLGQAHSLVLDTTAALTSVLDTHQYGSGCSECGTRGICRTVHGICEIFIPGGDPGLRPVSRACGRRHP